MSVRWLSVARDGIAIVSGDTWPERLATAVATVANDAPGRLGSRPGD